VAGRRRSLPHNLLAVIDLEADSSRCSTTRSASCWRASFVT
jgi:hypothetical protein